MTPPSSSRFVASFFVDVSALESESESDSATKQEANMSTFIWIQNKYRFVSTYLQKANPSASCASCLRLMTRAYVCLLYIQTREMQRSKGQMQGAKCGGMCVVSV